MQPGSGLAVLLGVVLGTGCGGDDDRSAAADPASAKTAPEEAGAAEKAGKDEGKDAGKGKRKKKSKRKPDPEFNKARDELDAFAERVGTLVENRDAAGLRALWVGENAFADCHVAEANLEPPEAEAKRRELLQAFDERARVELGSDRPGELIYVNRWARKKPLGMDGRFVGDDCKVRYMGRVNAIVLLDTTPVTHVEHRFDALRVEEQWQLLEYQPERPDCAGDAKDEIGCKKLKERLDAGGG